AVQGGRGFVEEADGVIYLAMSLRNVGSGIGVLQSWLAHGGRPEPDEPRPTRSGSVARAAISSYRRVDPALAGGAPARRGR
ncbi:MAG TPA: hypothetical protein VLV81_05235, partial [Acidimicrobiia bacterium]|nr:hypothetical protein [Acidimicrobiia bacterium]